MVASDAMKETPKKSAKTEWNIKKVDVMHRIVRVVLCRPINLGSVTAHLPRLPVSSVWKASRTDFRKRGVSHVMVHEYVSIELNEH